MAMFAVAKLPRESVAMMMSVTLGLLPAWYWPLEALMLPPEALLVRARRAPGKKVEDGGFAELIDDYDRGRRGETAGQHQPAPTSAAAVL